MRTVLIASALMFGFAGMANAATPAQPVKASLPTCSKTVKDHCIEAHPQKIAMHSTTKTAKTAKTNAKVVSAAPKKSQTRE